MGAIVIGRVVIRRLLVRDLRVRRLDIGELRINRLVSKDGQSIAVEDLLGKTALGALRSVAHEVCRRAVDQPWGTD